MYSHLKSSSPLARNKAKFPRFSVLTYISAGDIAITTYITSQVEVKLFYRSQDGIKYFKA
jgi:hypothetical protein